MDVSLIVKLNAILGIFTFCTSITLIICLAKIKNAEIFKRILPFAAGMVVVFLATVTVHIVLAVMNSQKHSREQVSVETKPVGNLTDDCYIVTSENYVLIDFSKSNCAEFGIILGDSPVSDYADGFSFSYLDLNKNKVEKSPIEMTVVKAEKKNGWCTATVSVSDQTPPGLYYIRVAHKFARFSTDVPVFVRRVEE